MSLNTTAAIVADAVIANLTGSVSAPIVVDTLPPVVDGGAAMEDLFWAGLTQSFLLVFLAEIGDKTFIMVMLLANKMNKLLLWIFATIAMNIMNAISVTIGAIFPLFMPKFVISVVVIALFFTFGLKMLYTGLCSKEEEGNDELEEAKETLERLEALNQKKEPLLGGTHVLEKRSSWKFWERSQYTLFMFLLMCTEWGDVSQVVAIGLAAKYGMLSIIIGGGLGFALCITFAILLGSVISQLCTEKWLSLISGCLFMGFGIRELYSVLSA
jgi:putative Ca2+/H+ antiporter (TMEM165/GDT1 family)